MIIRYTDIEGTRLSSKISLTQLAEHWASIPKVVGSIPTMARHIFQMPGVDIHSK